MIWTARSDENLRSESEFKMNFHQSGTDLYVIDLKLILLYVITGFTAGRPGASIAEVTKGFTGS